MNADGLNTDLPHGYTDVQSLPPPFPTSIPPIPSFFLLHPPLHRLCWLAIGCKMCYNARGLAQGQESSGRFAYHDKGRKEDFL